MRKHVVHVEQAGSSYDNLFIDLDPLEASRYAFAKGSQTGRP